MNYKIFSRRQYNYMGEDAFSVSINFVQSRVYKHMKNFYGVLVFLCPMLAAAQLAVTVSRPAVANQKAIITLKMTNGLGENVKSARAICFLLDSRGSLVGKSSKWVIGGAKNRPALEPKKETSFNFVITSQQTFATTNLTTKVSFSRVVLDDDKLADPKTDVQIQNVQ
jgi:hypothetical protein